MHARDDRRRELEGELQGVGSRSIALASAESPAAYGKAALAFYASSEADWCEFQRPGARSTPRQSSALWNWPTSFQSSFPRSAAVHQPNLLHSSCRNPFPAHGTPVRSLIYVIGPSGARSGSTTNWNQGWSRLTEGSGLRIANTKVTSSRAPRSVVATRDLRLPCSPAFP